MLWQNHTLSDLRSTTLEWRFSAIHSLVLHWEFRHPDVFLNEVQSPYDLATWKNACEVLKGMSALKELTITIKGQFSDGPRVLEILQSLREVQVDKEAFRVRVPRLGVLRSPRIAEDAILDQRIEEEQFPFRVWRPDVCDQDQDSQFWELFIRQHYRRRESRFRSDDFKRNNKDGLDELYQATSSSA